MLKNSGRNSKSCIKMEDKIGVAISLYDKFEDLSILTEIFRENFDEKYYIVVCCSHPNAKKEISGRDIDIDCLVDRPEIDYDPNMEGLEEKINLHSRILESFQNSAQETVMNSDYTLHLHADAWPLEEEKIIKIINRMKTEDKKIAARGIGPSIRNPSYRVGHVMDQFVFIESDYALENDVLEFNPLDLMPDAGIHTSLMLLILGKIGLSQTWFYSDMTEDVWWDGTQKPVFADPIPSTFSPKWSLIHIGADQFPQELGKDLQSYYLREFGITDGDNISEFIERYDREKEDIVDEINSIESSKDFRIKLLGIKPEDLGRSFVKKDSILEKPIREKTKILGKNLLGRSYRFVHILLNKSPWTDERFEGSNKREIYLYHDAPWPEKTYKSMYKSSVDKEKYPEKIDFWFEEDNSE